MFELAEILGFLSDWLESGRDCLTTSLIRSTGSPAYGPDSLQGDFAWFGSASSHLPVSSRVCFALAL
jgi:hypothetical protein